MSSPTSYTRTQIILHWVTFIVIFLQYVLHEGIAEAFEVVEHGGTAQVTPLVLAHIAGGLIVLVLAALRLQQRLTHGAPALPAEEPALQRMIAHATHIALYLLMIAMPVSGAVAWFGSSEAAGEAHEVMRAIMLLFILLHIIGALYHRFVLKSGVMQRMSLRG